LEAKCIPPLGALSSDIECRATRFVAAGCLPRSTLAKSAGEDKGAISTARGRDDCGKPFSQHLSFGATIRAPQECDPSAGSSAGMAGAAPVATDLKIRLADPKLIAPEKWS